MYCLSFETYVNLCARGLINNPLVFAVFWGTRKAITWKHASFTLEYLTSRARLCCLIAAAGKCKVICLA